MRMPLKKRLENTTVSILLLIFASSVCADQITDAKNAGNRAGNTVLGSFGSKGGIRLNISNPMTSNETQMRTLDGSVSFSGQLTCPSSSRFLEVFIQPSPMDDLSQVIVGQDIDMEGSIDYSYRVPFPVSGVCANGVISCDAGTWSNCRHYKWTADSSYRVGLQEAGITDLGGCYCINNSCGSNLVWTNIPLILKDLGGGVAGVIQARNPQYAVSDVKIDGTAITYYGQRTGGCETVGGGSGVTDPQKYYENWAALNNDVETSVISQSGDPESYYNMIAKSLAAEQNPAELRKCTIRKVPVTEEIGVYDVVAPVGGSEGTVRSCGNKCIEIVLGREGNNYWCAGCEIFETYFNILVKRPEMIQSATLVRAMWDDWMQIWIDDDLAWFGPYEWTSPTGYPPGRCELSTSWDWYPNADLTRYFREEGIIETRNRIAVAGCGEGFVIIRLRINTVCDVNISVFENCSNIENNTTCQLKEERVDGVFTYRDFNPTGLIPVASCRDVSCESDIVRVCEDWWQKERTYLCQAQGLDFNGARKRLDRITSTATDNTTSLYYQDLRKDKDGNWINESNTIYLPSRDPYSDCERACKTKKPSTNTQAGVTGNATEYQTSTTTYDFFYKSCVNDLCPLVVGEEIIKDCQCINDFAEAASIMESLKEASKDIICSSGAKQ